VQGYLLAKPLVVADFENLLHEQAAKEDPEYGSAERTPATRLPRQLRVVTT
jgi:hypothetical protein